MDPLQLASQKVQKHLADEHALGQDKQRAYTILNGNFLCLSCPSAFLAHQQGVFVPRDWPAAKGPFESFDWLSHHGKWDIIQWLNLKSQYFILFFTK